jgi:hypothetical protein
MATPRSADWELTVGGAGVPSRDAFGVATAYDVGTAGAGTLRFAQPVTRTIWLVVLGALWLVTLVAASRLSIPARLRTRRAGEGALIDLDAEPGANLPDERTGFAGWVDDLFEGDDDAEAPPNAAQSSRPVATPEDPL